MLIFTSFFDLSLGMYLYAMLLYGLAVVISIGGVVLLEAAVLWLMKWNSFLRSLYASFLVNLITTVSGFYLGPTPSTLSNIHETGFIPRFALLCGLSALIEGGLLLLIRRQPWIKTFKAACVMNISSYIFLYLFILVILDMYNG
jgi:hypothetical protein